MTEGRIAPRRIHQLQARLLRHYGPQHWWPGRSAFEVLAGAILVQRTRWQNAEAALRNLTGEDLLDPDALAQCSTARLERLIRSAGFYRQKARRLKAASRWLAEQGGIENLRHHPTPDLRRRLLGLSGIGPETADCVLLYVFDRPVFIADAYARRLFQRLGWIDTARNIDYERLATQVHPLDGDARFFNELHALIVVHGQSVCAATPRCRQCVLRPECGTARLADDATARRHFVR